jgi:hypothetical protein
MCALGMMLAQADRVWWYSAIAVSSGGPQRASALFIFKEGQWRECDVAQDMQRKVC